MLDARDVADRLAASAESVCAMCLPGGKQIGHEWEYDPGHGKIKVELNGAKRGKWSHFGGDASGDMLDLWAHMKTGGDMKAAFKEACQWLGLEQPKFAGTTGAKTYKRPARPANVRPAMAGTAVEEYLRGERGLSRKTIEAFRIMEAAQMDGARDDGSTYSVPGPWILFPYYRADEVDAAGKPVLANIKWLNVNRDKDGKKRTKQESGAEPTLFGWQTIPDDAKQVCLTEGEIDAMSVHQWGFHALSLPQGAGTGAKQNWIETEWENLDRFETIFLCMDADAEGQKTIPELIKRLGAHRCRVVTLPHKDANDCLCTHGMDRAKALSYFENARYLEPDELRSAASFSDAVVDRFHPRDESTVGIALPWEKAGKIRLRPGEVTLWSGINGHGKSSMISQAVLHACDRGFRSCIYSGEQGADLTLAVMVQQMADDDRPAIPRIRNLTDWFQGRLWLYNVKGRTERGRLLEVFRYARRRYGIDLFLIDSMMRCGIAEDDYNTQGDFMDELITFAADEGCHVIMVVHPAKALDESRPVGKLRMKGTGKLSDLAHNCIETWRNKPKEKKAADIDSNAALSEIEKADKMEDLRKKPDTKLVVDKQRVGGWEGTINLWYRHSSRSWFDARGGFPPEFSSIPPDNPADSF